MRINYKDLEYRESLPKILHETPFVNVGLKYEDFLKQYTPAIIEKLSDDSNLKVMNQVDGKPIRSSLKDTAVCEPIVSFFEKEFGGERFMVHVNRSHVVDIPSNNTFDVDTSEIWISEFWHIDNVQRPVIGIGIYLTDVDDDSAPMTYEDPPENNFFAPIDNYTNWTQSRFLDFEPKNPVNITGPKHTTFLFVPNFLHKANYARKKQRDALYMRLAL